MLRLVESSNPDDVTRHNVRAHYTERLVLTASVCRELQREPDGFVGGRAEAALDLLNQWMRERYDLPKDRDVDYSHGLDDPRLVEYASDMQRELELATNVCSAFFMLFTADTESQYRGDLREIKAQLAQYLTEFEQ